MLLRALIIGIFLGLGLSCTSSPLKVEQMASPMTTPPPYELDRAKARGISDSIVDALIKNDRSVLLSKMEKGAREYYGHDGFNNVVDQMVESFGSPAEAKFKKVEQGRKWAAGGYDKPMLKHWYAVRTSKYDYGSHFIFVEIVPDDDEYASSGVAIVSFPMGIPEDMQ